MKRASSVGAPEEPLPSFHPFNLLMSGVKLGGSAIGSPAVIREMLDLVATQNVKPWIVKRPIKDVNSALPSFPASCSVSDASLCQTSSKTWSPARPDTATCSSTRTTVESSRWSANSLCHCSRCLSCLDRIFLPQSDR